MSEAPEADTFDTDFAAARDAERDDAPDVNDAADGEVVDGGAEGGEEAPPEQEKSPAELRAEKAEKKAADLQKAMKAERRQRQDLEKRFEALEKAPKADDKPLSPAELAKLLRDDDDDPIGDIQTVKKLAKLLVGQDEQENAATAEATRRTMALNTIASTVKDYEDDFRELNPDYDKAAQHFMKARAEELADTGLEGNALSVAMQNDFAGIVTRSIQAGKDPAEIIYSMAKRRGFTGETPAAADTEAATKLAAIAKGQEQSRNLSGGAAASGNMTMGKVADLRGAAFDSAFEKLRASERRR